MRFGRALAMLACMLLCFSGCQAASAPGAGSTQAGAQANAQQEAEGEQMNGEYTADSLISDVIPTLLLKGMATCFSLWTPAITAGTRWGNFS